MKYKNRILTVHYISMVIIGIAFFLPIIWLILASLDTNATLSIKPFNASLSNYAETIKDSVTQRALLNSLVISLGQAFISIFVSLLAAYPLSRLYLKYKREILLGILFMTGLPVIALMVPVYQMFAAFHFQNSLIAVILFMATASLPFNIWLLRSFMNVVPITLEESARIDGANTWQVLTQIIIPLMVPGIATVFIISFSGSWGNFFVPFILLSDANKLPAAVKIYDFFGDYGIVAYGKLAAFSVVYTMPSIILYVFSHKFMAKGLGLTGADK